MNFLFGSDAYTIPIGHKLSAGAYMHNYTVSDTHLGGFLFNINTIFDIKLGDLSAISCDVFVAVILINVVNVVE